MVVPNSKHIQTTRNVNAEAEADASDNNTDMEVTSFGVVNYAENESSLYALNTSSVDTFRYLVSTQPGKIEGYPFTTSTTAANQFLAPARTMLSVGAGTKKAKSPTTRKTSLKRS